MARICARHLLDCAVAVLVPRAGMRRHPGRPDLEAPDALARRDHLAALARRLGDQHIARTARFRLDHGAGGRAADLLVGREQMGHRQSRRAGARHLAEGRECQIGAALHVEEAGTVELVAFAPEPQRAGQHADRMHGVDMRQDQDAGTLAGASGAQRQDIGEAVTPRNPLPHERQVDGIGLHAVDHAVDRVNVRGGALDLDPRPDAVDDCSRSSEASFFLPFMTRLSPSWPGEQPPQRLRGLFRPSKSILLRPKSSKTWMPGTRPGMMDSVPNGRYESPRNDRLRRQHGFAERNPVERGALLEP